MKRLLSCTLLFFHVFASIRSISAAFSEKIVDHRNLIIGILIIDLCFDVYDICFFNEVLSVILVLYSRLWLLFLVLDPVD